MSKIFKCNVCGKNEFMHNVKFSSGPVVLRMKTYDDRDIRMFLYLGGEYESDYYETLRELGIEKFYDIDENQPVMFDDNPNENIRKNLRGNVGFDLKFLDGGSDPFTICDMCKKDMSTRILRNAICREQANQTKVNIVPEHDFLMREMEILRKQIEIEAATRLGSVEKKPKKRGRPPKNKD